MDSPPTTDPLQVFQSSGRKEDLLAYLRATGRKPDEHSAAIDALGLALEPPSFGLRPAVRVPDREGLVKHAAATTEILAWLSASPKADLKTAAMELMGSLGWDAFIPALERSLSSSAVWERIAAIQSLALVPGQRAADLIRGAAGDADPAVRAAAHRALDSHHETRPRDR